MKKYLNGEAAVTPMQIDLESSYIVTLLGPRHITFVVLINKEVTVARRFRPNRLKKTLPNAGFNTFRQPHREGPSSVVTLSPVTKTKSTDSTTRRELTRKE